MKDLSVNIFDNVLYLKFVIYNFNLVYSFAKLKFVPTFILLPISLQTI